MLQKYSGAVLTSPVTISATDSIAEYVVITYLVIVGICDVDPWSCALSLRGTELLLSSSVYQRTLMDPLIQNLG